MKSVIALSLLSATALAQGDPCKTAHTDQASCDADKKTAGGCTWCKCGALPSACWTLANSKKLPPGVYQCDSAATAAVTKTQENAPKYTRIPFGRSVLSHCLHEIPSGSSHVSLSNGDTLVTPPNGISYTIPKCKSEHPVFRFEKPTAAAAAPPPAADVTNFGRPLPPDYDGWLQYTELNITDVDGKKGFDQFTSYMSVPDIPKEAAQQLFFFPGLQNIDWIPKVDPEPTESTPFDIIQPVLQYPGGFFGREWALKSWYVTINAGALYSSALTVKEGDQIFCNMTRTGENSFIVRGTVNSTGKSTEQSATNARLTNQPWAYSAVAECYGCDGCKTFPTKPIVFSENKLYENGNLFSIPGDKWNLNPKPAQAAECHEATTVATNGDATISFQQKGDDIGLCSFNIHICGHI